MVNYWFCVVNKENWEIIKEEKLWGVSERNRKHIESTQIGDFLVFYVKHNELAGIFQIVSQPFENKEEVFKSIGLPAREIFPHRVKLEPIIIPKKPKDFLKLVPKLGFITNKQEWGAYLRKAMQWIRKDSYETLKQALTED